MDAGLGHPHKIKYTRKDAEPRTGGHGLLIPGHPREINVRKDAEPRCLTPASEDFMSMDDLADFAEWAFGPTGFPNLLVLAYGDFSHQGRFRWTNLLFCRNSVESCGEYW